MGGERTPAADRSGGGEGVGGRAGAASSPTTGPGRARGWLFWAACIALALIVRMVNFPVVFTSSGVQLVGTDPYYHLRRIEQCVRYFPHLIGFDPYLGHPYGALNPYEPGFDFLLSAIVRIVSGGGVPSEARMVAICAAVMPLIGLLVLPLYAAIAHALMGRNAARITAVLLAILPGVAFPAQLGQVDHHVLEPLVIGLPMLLALYVLEAPNRQRSVLLAGVTLGGGLLFWRGILLPAAILAATFGIRAVWQAIFRPVDELTRFEAPFLFAVAGAVALPIGLSSPVQERVSYFTVSLLQPLVLGIFSLTLLLVGQVCIRAARLHARREAGTLRAAGPEMLIGAVLALIGALPTVVAVVAFPAVVRNLLAGLGFLARGDAFVLAVGEQRPLFLSDDGQPTLLYAVYFYGAFFVLAPVLAWIAWRRRHGDPIAARRTSVAPDFRWLLMVLWSGTLAAMAVMQRRYAASFAPIYGVWLGMGLAALWPRVAAAGMLWQGTAAAIGTLLLMPGAVLVAGQVAAPLQDPARLEAMQWIREHTPPTASFDLPPSETGYAAPEYGILASWDEGHHLVFLGHRPNIANPFGIEWFRPGINRAAHFWLAPAEKAASAMDAAGARFALVSFRLGLLRDEARFIGEDPDRYALGSPDGWKPGPEFGSTAAARLYLGDGLADGRRSPVEGVRLVWEGGSVARTEPAAALAGVGAPVYKLFERVQGARFVGDAPPGSQVTAALTVVTPTGRRVQWGDRVHVGDDSRFRIVVPYAGAGTPEGWARAAGPLTLRWDGGEWQGAVAEADVVAGNTVFIHGE